MTPIFWVFLYLLTKSFVSIQRSVFYYSQRVHLIKLVSCPKWPPIPFVTFIHRILLWYWVNQSIKSIRLTYYGVVPSYDDVFYDAKSHHLCVVGRWWFFSCLKISYLPLRFVNPLARLLYVFSPFQRPTLFPLPLVVLHRRVWSVWQYLRSKHLHKRNERKRKIN